MPDFTIRTVQSTGVALACRDYGGTGPDLVLMHGAGMTQQSLAKVVAHLTGDLRVVTFDFRGHGETPAATWTMDTAVSDLEAVIASFGLTNPSVGGHSLGGMVAADYARRHPECPGAINIDGHGMGRPEQYVGKDQVAVAEWMRVAKQRAATVTGGPLMKLVGLVGRLTGQRPVDRESMSAVLAMVEELDLVATYAAVKGPLQVFNAHAPQTGVAAKLMKDPDGNAAAYREGIRRELTELAKTHPNIELAELDATHSLIRTHPEQTAALMRSFLLKA